MTKHSNESGTAHAMSHKIRIPFLKNIFIGGCVSSVGCQCASAVVMLDRPCQIRCTTAGYPLHSPFSPSLLHPCVSLCHHIPFLLYCTCYESQNKDSFSQKLLKIHSLESKFCFTMTQRYGGRQFWIYPIRNLCNTHHRHTTFTRFRLY